MPKFLDLFKLPSTSLAREFNKNFFEPFWWVFLTLLVIFIPIVRPWWWVILPIFFCAEVKKLYRWWIAWDFAYPKTKWVMLEIIPPRETLTPIKAMEDVFALMFFSVSDLPNFREVWCDGRLESAPDWMTYEIFSIGGEIHITARVTTGARKALEDVLYSHYPEIEIREVDDYAQAIPQNIPNEEWDMYGEDYILQRPEPYPIKTYEKFFEPQGEKISAEEKRIDPITSLFESISKLGPGEIYWMQFLLMGVFDPDEPQFKKEGMAIINKLARRPEKTEKKGGGFLTSILNELVAALHTLVGGKNEGAVSADAAHTVSEEGDREMVLTPGEREIMTEVERKLSKQIYRTAIRGIYVAKRENFSSSNKLAARTYFGHFSTNNLNYLSFSKVTRTKVHDFFRKRRVFHRARRMLKTALLRFPPMFPDRRSECTLLGPEELATLFHFPIKISGTVLPTMTRIESKRGGAPPNLPTQ